ncbi:MAG TPA: flagellar filament capping protein FliD, partial [Clostridia bacterium]|nr:flagellar filament capping protein FliD [Clostridia bacterium]
MSMVMRIGGIASGIDTEQMVMDLMRAERMKVDKFFRQEEALKWRREALNTTNKTLADFILKARSNFGLTRLTGTGTILKNSIQNFDWVKKVSSGGENIIKATATAAAMEGTYEIEVGQLAEVASVMSKKIQGAKDGEDSNNLLDDKGKFEEDVYGDITIVTKAGSKVFTIGNGEGEITSIDELVKAINNAEVDDSGKKISLGLRAAYDKTLGRLMINAKEMGSDQKIEIEGNSADKFFEKATMENPQGTSNEWYGGIGKDAVVSINGQTVDGLKSNNFSMFGVNYSLQSTGTVTINVETDVDGIFDKVKEFVDNY